MSTFIPSEGWAVHTLLGKIVKDVFKMFFYSLFIISIEILIHKKFVDISESLLIVS